MYANQHLFKEGAYNENWASCLAIFKGFDWSNESQVIIDLFGKLDNGKLNLVYESSLRKHFKLVELFEEMLGEEKEIKASTA